MRDLRGDIKLAKSAFIAAMVGEFKEKAFPEATLCLDETETLLCENQGVVVVGEIPTGGHLGTAPDGIMRLQPTWAGGRIACFFPELVVTFRKPTNVSLTECVPTKATKVLGRGKVSKARANVKVNSCRVIVAAHVAMHFRLCRRAWWVLALPFACFVS